MLFKRTIPPAASPLSLPDFYRGLIGLLRQKRNLKNFTESLKCYYNVRYCFLFSSGQAAFCTILHALKGLQPDRNNVIIPGFTCYSVAAAIKRAELNISLCDLESPLGKFDMKKLLEMLSAHGSSQNQIRETSRSSPPSYGPNPLAVVYAHLFGLQPGIQEIVQTVKSANSILIEDAAQAMGSELEGQLAGTFGDVGFFSLGRGKPLSTVEGGIIITDNDDIGCRLMKVYERIPRYSIKELIVLILKALAIVIFQHPALFWFPKSLPFLKLGETIYDPRFKIRVMSGFQAGLAQQWRRKIVRFNQRRMQNVHFWQQNLPSGEMISSMLPVRKATALLRFPLLVSSDSIRRKILKLSHNFGLGIMPAYPDYIGGIDELKHELSRYQCNNSTRYARMLITLPVHSLLSQQDKYKILSLLKQA